MQRGMSSDVKELGLIRVVSVLSFALTCTYEASYIPFFFGMTAALSLIEAIRRSS
jgi:hypothetical protein